jgi:hypothetical protein
VLEAALRVELRPAYEQNPAVPGGNAGGLQPLQVDLFGALEHTDARIPGRVTDNEGGVVIGIPAVDRQVSVVYIPNIVLQ